MVDLGKSTLIFTIQYVIGRSRGDRTESQGLFYSRMKSSAELLVQEKVYLGLKDFILDAMLDPLSLGHLYIQKESLFRRGLCRGSRFGP